MPQRCAFIRQGSTLLVAVALLLSACVGQSTRQVSSPPTPTAVPRPTPVSGLLDPLPANCQQTFPPDTRLFGPVDGFSGQFSVDGGGPAWLTSSLYSLHLNANGYDPLPSTKMLWAIGPDNSQTVTIQGIDLLSGTPMWVEVYGVSPATTGILPPGQGNRGGGNAPDGTRWEIWGTGLIFLKAGCYQMTVRWPNGQWTETFAVGR